MNENGYENQEHLIKPEIGEDGFTQKERELVEQWLPKYEEEAASEPEREDAERHITELLSKLQVFEAMFSVGELITITDAAEAYKSGTRKRAAKSLNPIEVKLKYLKDKTNISAEKYAEIDAWYKRLSSAVGYINGNKVLH